MMKYYYAYQCSPSTELRGRRPDHDKGCGKWSVRGSNTNLQSLSKKNSIQSRPCNHPKVEGGCCGKRQRLHAHNTWTAPVNEGWDLDPLGRPLMPNREKMKEWATNFVKEKNRQLSNSAKIYSDKESTNDSDVSTIVSDVSTAMNNVTTSTVEVE